MKLLKTLLDRWGGYQDFRKNFPSHSAKQFHAGFLCFRNFPIPGFRCILRNISFFKKVFLSYGTKFFRGSPLCFRKFLIWKLFRHRGEGIPLFSLEFFCLTVTEFFVDEPFCVSKKLNCRKFSCITGGGGINCFRQKKFLSQCEKLRRRNFSFSFLETFGYLKAFFIRGVNHDFL